MSRGSDAVLENVDICGPQAMLVLGLVAEGLQHRSECPNTLHSLVHAQRPAENSSAVRM